MPRYYTRACNFYFGKQSKILVNKKQSIPLHQIKEISFDHVEIITRKKIRKISINKNLYPKDKILDNPESKDDQDSALGAMGLKPKIVH